MAELKPGKYIGRLLDYGIGKTKAGLPSVMLKFEFKDDEGNPFQRMWFGSLKEGKARQITLDALLTCGFKGDDLSVIAEGVGNGALDTDRDVRLTVTTEPDQNGTMQTRLRWIGDPSDGEGIRDKVSKGEAVGLLGGIDVGGDLAERRSKKATKAAEAPKPFSSDGVPF